MKAWRVGGSRNEPTGCRGQRLANGRVLTCLDHRLGDELGAALCRTTGSEEALPNTANDHDLRPRLEAGRRQRVFWPCDRYYLDETIDPSHPDLKREDRLSIPCNALLR